MPAATRSRSSLASALSNATIVAPGGGSCRPPSPLGKPTTSQLFATLEAEMTCCPFSLRSVAAGFALFEWRFSAAAALVARLGRRCRSFFKAALWPLRAGGSLPTG